MSEDAQQLKITSLENRQHILQKKLVRLSEQLDLETRVEEIMRIESEINKTKILLQSVENQLLGIQQQEKLAEANRLKRIGSPREAIAIWQEIQDSDPDNSVATREITALEKLADQQAISANLVKRLALRIRDIRPVFKAVVNALHQPADTAEYAILLEQTELLLDDVLDADSYLLWWEAIHDNSLQNIQSIDIGRIAGRVQRGEMVLFIGSGITSIYSGQNSEENALVTQLAQQIGYEQFNGSLSSIAEYYQLRPDFGQPELLKTLRGHLSQNGHGVLLYKALAKIQAPLILISSAYDNRLEKAFRAADKPFVELSSIVRRSDEYDIGHVVVNYSDSDSSQAAPVAGEKLSGMRFLEQGYSVIYKIRGNCGTTEGSADEDELLQQDALTLSESSYFSFARYADKIIPGYLARQLRNRGFLFVGYQPKDWEDRLLASALLEKRNSQEPCYVIGDTSEPMETAFWKSRSVEPYPIDIRELDKYLEEVAV
uniref:CobQ/CobB/MinD/ParA nucleotide binding domain-containing protein n=1 Tax=uncultured Thiotrichaceae bacterium TaxID=298394 RepID=A0A6S6TZK2_9GAMM|nr:MAG: CobQ/CobB/MinD/ParA nucleotide binding domain-containing protein [uncultured Thiotrichaceae bacterium]